MNKEQAENEFQVGLRTLLEDIEKQVSPDAPDPYAGGVRQAFLEHTTRIYFFDRFLELLGWRLGIHGDVLEEARVKAGTTTFMDYVGVNYETRAPALMLEAKAWDTPFIARRNGTGFRGSERELMVAAIGHVRNGGTSTKSPATRIWHEFLEQVGGYVRRLKEQSGHALPCAVLASGQWFVVFRSPTVTFLDGDVNDEQFAIFKIDKYVEESRDLFALLSQSELASVVPFLLRPSQLPDYVTAETISAVFHGLHVTYESSGSKLFAPRPRILVYPALIIQRDDGTCLTAIDGELPIVVDMKVVGDGGEKSLSPHLTEVADKAAALLKTCSNELRTPLKVFPLSDFPGFPEPQGVFGNVAKRKRVVKPLKEVGDEWLLATGESPHYLKDVPEVHPCRFHTWAECRDVAYQTGAAAISTSSTTAPRSFFVDAQIYHCAHQTVHDRRHKRCHIAPLDQRTCCRACVYQDLCWTPTELEQLPCGT